MFIVYFIFFYSTVQHSVHSCWEECSINKVLLTYLLTSYPKCTHCQKTPGLQYSLKKQIQENRVREFSLQPQIQYVQCPVKPQVNYGLHLKED